MYRVKYCAGGQNDAANVPAVKVKKKRSIKIKTVEEQLEEAAMKKSTARVRRKTTFNSLEKLLPKYIQGKEIATIASTELAAKLKDLEMSCDIKSQLAAELGSKVLRDNIKKTLKESGLKNREKAELELLALIEMTQALEALIACIRSK